MMSLAIANLGTAARFGKRETLCGHWDRIHTAITAVFPVKTAANMSAVTGLTPRACEYFLSRRTGLSSDAVVALLASEEGLTYLTALLGDAKPTWWKKLKRSARREIVQREIEGLQREMQAIDDDYAAQAPPTRHHQATREVGQTRTRQALRRQT